MFTEMQPLLDVIEKNGVNCDIVGLLLFACAGISQAGGIESEEALSYENDKFLTKFKN